MTDRYKSRASTHADDWSVARGAADEIERLRKLLDRIAVRHPDGSVAIRLTEDALNAAAEYLTPNAGHKPRGEAESA